MSEQVSIGEQCRVLNTNIDHSYRSFNQIMSTLEYRNFTENTSLSEEEQNDVEAVLDKLGKYKSKIQQLEQELKKSLLAGHIRDMRGRGTLNIRDSYPDVAINDVTAGESGYDSMYSLTSKELRKSDSLSIHTQVTDPSESLSAGAGVTSQPVEHVDLEHSATSASIRLTTVPESRRQKDSDPEAELTALNIADDKDEEHSA